MLWLVVVRLLERLLLVLIAMVVHLTFPPAAVYHTSKMHSHRRMTGPQGGTRGMER